MSKVSRLCTLLLLLSVVLSACKKKPVDWSIHMNKGDKNPYDTYLAHNSLKYFFPSADIKDLSRSYRFSSIDGGTINNSSGTTLMVLTGLNFDVSEKEWQKLKMFVRSGNELVIFASAFDSKITDAFHIERAGADEEMEAPDAQYFESNKDVLQLAGDHVRRFGYVGRPINGYFAGRGVNYTLSQLQHKVAPAADTVQQSAIDTAITIAGPDSITVTEEDYDADTYADDSYLMSDTLSLANGRPDCLRIAMGRGHITLHAAPLVTSNFFLLQGRNIDYLAGLWSALPADINKIYWDDYYTHSSQESDSNALWKYAPTRYGLLLAILVAVTYVLFQMKRRQRIVPVIPPLRNDSVSFVETVGRLYYNKGNNANLAEKMAQQFLEWVRMNCYLGTNRLNEEFIQQLTVKTGQPQANVEALVQMIQEVRLGGVEIDDAYLYQFYTTIQEFYKNHHTQWKA